MLAILAQDDFVELTPTALQAIDKGLAYLAENQGKDGSFGNPAAPVAATSLAGLAFLAGGHAPGRGKYGENIRKAVEFLIRNTSRQGYINEGSGAKRARGGSGMHGHGYAMLFLSQVYGMADTMDADEVEKLKDILRRAVRCTEQAQAPNGGWYYHPVASGDEGSVTITQVQALRALQNAGIQVNPKTVQKAIEYIHKSTTDEGRTLYSLNHKNGVSNPPLTAAGMCVLTYLGQYASPKIAKGLSVVMKELKPGKDFRKANYPLYGGYYAAVAMYQAGDRYWREWWPAHRQGLIETQAKDGAWRLAESKKYGDTFGTALAALTLQIPCRYLPIFQRGQD